MTFEAWRARARSLAASHVPPSEASWESDGQHALFATPCDNSRTDLRVSREFLKVAELAAAHRDPRKWPLLYSVLYRITHGEPHLLEIVTDSEVHRLLQMHKQVGHDIHRMHAFVRFREVDGRYVAWYEPDHLIVEPAAPWFANRFAAMPWSILTPDCCAHWDTHELTYSAGAARSSAPQGDPLEDLWRAYYASTFNPARTNLDLLKTHMPRRKWSLLPEAGLIAAAARSAQPACDAMLSAPPRSAAGFIPAGATLPVLQEAIRSCRGCDLHERATQPVFGEGPASAKIVVVGEQPGDNEDREGRPFIGPAGQLFDRALADAGLIRGDLYITGAVKHFRFEERGKKRIHKTASRAQIAACQPWLDAQLAAIRPHIIVCMGNTAALSVLGRGIRLLEERGRLFPHRYAEAALPTVHPSFLLRMPDETRRAYEYDLLVKDLAAAKAFAA